MVVSFEAEGVLGASLTFFVPMSRRKACTWTFNNFLSITRRVGPKSQPLLLCSLAKIHHSQESPQSVFPLSLISLLCLYSVSFSFRFGFGLLMVVVEAMPPLLHHLLLPLLLLVVAAAGGGVHCVGEKKVVSLEELQGSKSSTAQPWLPQETSSKIF